MANVETVPPDPISGDLNTGPMTGPMPGSPNYPGSLPGNVSASPAGVPFAQASDPNYQLNQPSSAGASPSGPTPPGQQGLPAPYQGPAQRGGAVKNALTRMMYGMGQAMLQHVGLPTDYEIQRTQYQQALQGAQLQVQQQHQQLLEQAQQYQQSRSAYVMPNGATAYLTPAEAAKVLPASVSGEYGLQKEQIAKHYIPTQQGILDTWTGTYKPGTQQGAMVDDDIIKEYPVLAPYKGQVLKPQDLMKAYSVTMQGLPVTRSSTDPLGLTTTSTTQKTTPIAPGRTAAPSVPGAAPPQPRNRATAPMPPSTGGTKTGNPLQDMAVQMVEGNADPSQVPKRGSANLVIAALANAYSQQKYGKPFDMAQAATDYKYANQPSTQNTLKYLNSLTGPDNKSGNLQKLVSMSDSPDLARTQWPPINDLQAWARLKSGSGPQAAYAAAITETADQVAKILQGGGTASGTSDAKLQQANALFQKGFNTGQIRDVASTLRDLLGNRKNELIGNNRYLMRQFGQGIAAPAAAGGGAGGDLQYARDLQGKLHSAPKGQALPQGWTPAKPPGQ